MKYFFMKRNFDLLYQIQKYKLSEKYKLHFFFQKLHINKLVGKMTLNTSISLVTFDKKRGLADSLARNFEAWTK